jgi:hypothetical protein
MTFVYYIACGRRRVFCPVQLTVRAVASLLLGSEPESTLIQIVNTATARIFQRRILGYNIITRAEETIVTYSQPNVTNVVVFGEIQLLGSGRGYCHGRKHGTDRKQGQNNQAEHDSIKLHQTLPG